MYKCTFSSIRLDLIGVRILKAEVDLSRES
eukprot:COSAG02_NODE_141_length_34311_cov_54.733135_13_plen_30_part_00